MKKLLTLFIVLLEVGMSKPTEAQVRINVNIQPLWGPAGYDYVEYYYMPDIDVYYHVPSRRYVYLSSGRWIFAATLPPIYHHYDIYRGYKVVLNEPRAYLHHDVHVVKFKEYKGKQQVIIRDQPKQVHVHHKHGGKGKGKWKRDN